MRALEGCRVSSKSPSSILVGSCWKERKSSKQVNEFSPIWPHNTYLIASPIVRADREVSIVFDRFRSSGLNHQVPPPEGSEESKGFYSYDLYAVCNHHGSDLQGGHYTATCRNPTDGHWYLFDDNHVQKLDADREVVTEEAYILFYQRYATFSAKQPADQAFLRFSDIQGP